MQEILFEKQIIIASDIVKKSIFLVLLFVLTCGSEAFAESDDDPLTKDFGDIANSLYVSSGVGGKAGGNTGGIVGPLSSEFMGTNNGLMPGKQLQGSEIVNGKTSLEAKPGKKQSDFHTYIPKKQFEKMMDSKEWEGMYNDSIKNNSISMIGATTWGLANSAVGQARYNAIMQTKKSMQNHYMAELAFIKQVEQNPYMRHGISDAYFSCVRKKMQEDKNGGNGGKYTWFEAQEACMDDESSTNSNDSVQPSLFDYSKVNDAKSGTTNTICLSDYLFNQEAGDGQNSSGQNEGSDSAKKLKESYQKLFGDIEFKMDDSNTSGNREAIGMRNIKYVYYFPGSDTQADGSNNCGMSLQDSKSPSDLFLDVLEHRYRLLITALGRYCQLVKRDGNLTGYFDSNEYKELVEYYKVAGYDVTPQLIDNLYKIANDTEPADDGKVKCNVFTYLIVDGNDDVREALQNAGSDNNNNDANGTSRLYKKIFYNIAKNVSEITVMNLYSVFYNYLLNLTTGVFGVESQMYTIADNQINQVVRSAIGIDLSQAYAYRIANLQNLRNINIAVNDLINAQAQGLTSIRRDGNNQIQPSEEMVSPN